MRRFSAILVLVSLTALPLPAFAYVSQICGGAYCDVSEVGRFMQGITRQCGNQGDCTLADILQVFVNTAYFVLGLIGSVVLLMYLIGGFYWLTSAGISARVSKGKEFLKISTIGLFIVLFSYIGIEFLLRMLTEGRVNVPSESCIGKVDGSPCGSGLTCQGQICTLPQIAPPAP
ncbi:hypothetical protein FJZ23_02895 [Candidatus Parcubacteria bacterium]|nr:hypothetical protein [Candidatus Parcubacteria bacterium]